MKFNLLFMVGLLACSAALDAQDKGGAAKAEPPVSERLLNLEATDIIKTQVQGSPFNRVGCDEDGNIYVRIYGLESARNGNLLQVPIQKVKTDGSLAETFEITSFDPDASGADFFVASQGELYQSAWKNRNEMYLVRFASDGSMKSKTKLETSYFMPHQVAVFKSGEILASGTIGEKGHTPFTGIFDASGKLISKLSASHDDLLKKGAETGDADVVSQRAGGAGITAVTLGDAVPGSDGNIYLMRSISPAAVYVISPGGELLRVLKVDAGDTTLFPIGMRGAPGKLAITFHHGHDDLSVDGILKVIDYEGNPIATYGLKASWAGGPLACYTPPQFTFVNTRKDGFLYFFKAEPK
jgi:hypothetical protein